MLVECQACGRLCDGSVSCPTCRAMFYCRPQHKAAHWRSQHRFECARMALQKLRSEELRALPFSFTSEATAQVDASEVTICSFLVRRGLHGRGIWQAQCGCSYLAGSQYGTLGGTDCWDGATWHAAFGSPPLAAAPPIAAPPPPATSLLRDCGGCTDGSSARRADAPLMSAPSAAGWLDYYTWRRLPLDSPACLVLHTALTVFHCLRIAAAARSAPFPPAAGALVTVHILGPERELDELAALRELLALLPHVDLRVNLVGPAVPESRDGEVTSFSPPPGEEPPEVNCAAGKACCSRQELDPAPPAPGRLTLHLRRGHYHELHPALAQVAPPPDLVFAPNAGLAAYDTWQPTVRRSC